ncbi:c-type cytochrome [Rhizorhabdus phycosphaerae]|uniref:c-type cytochrome n=1 Tax=Rhizorhabdus phycosphaerae TaxID=2711156 RepID=UPI0019D04376|nr:cytochrome c [Rhizorhabdus phycosphaerae]
MIVVMAALAPLAAAAAATGEGDVGRGHDLAQSRCGACHAVEATGRSPLRKAPAFRTLHRRYPVESLDEALAEGIVAGHPDMPSDPWEAGDIADFIAYLEWLAPFRSQRDWNDLSSPRNEQEKR